MIERWHKDTICREYQVRPKFVRKNASVEIREGFDERKFFYAKIFDAGDRSVDH